MTLDVPLRCRCAKVRGRALGLDPARGNRLVCMCDDCQAYGRWLATTPTFLDRSGGTEVFQTTPAQVRIDEGREQLRCVRLSHKGLMRWYTQCCRVPIANHLASARAPFLGLAAAFIDLDEAERERILGPILARIQGRYGIPPLPPNSYQRAPLGLILRSIRQLARGFVQAAHSPSPVRDASGALIVTPMVLSAEAREQLRAVNPRR